MSDIADDCTCDFHSLSKEERKGLIDVAVDNLNAEIAANGGRLPIQYEEGYDNLLAEITRRIKVSRGDG